MRGQQFGDEAAVVLRDPAGQFLPRQLLTLALEFRRHDEVDPVGLPTPGVVDPREFLIQLLRRERRRPEHTEPAGVGHGGHHIPAMTEREKREIDTELLTDRGLHLTSITKSDLPVTRSAAARTESDHPQLPHDLQSGRVSVGMYAQLFPGAAL